MKSGEIKLFIGILVIALALVGVAVYPTLSKPTPPPPVPHEVKSLTRDVLIPKGSHERGKADAPFVLVEFGDYECPTCKTMFDSLKEIMKKYDSKLKLVYHHCQIKADHKNSARLAMAAYAAGEQGKFWEMHDRIYEAQNKFRELPPEQVLEELMRLATEVKLDVFKFRSDMTSDGARNWVTKEQETGRKADVTGTPSFYFVAPSGVPKFIPHTTLKDWLNVAANWK